MKTGQFVIAFDEGLHARPASELVRICNEIESELKLTKDDMVADPKSIFEIMALGAENGETVTLEVEGPDEEEGFNVLKEFFEKK